MTLANGMPEPSGAVAGALRRFSVHEYHRMLDAGILTEDDSVELLEGLLVEKMVRKPRHDVAVSLVQSALGAKLPPTLFCRVQSAITTRDSEPEPDVAVVLAPPRRYTDRHPEPADGALVVEVAEASLDRDRRDKARLYSRAGIAQYWIVNLVDDEVEVCMHPAAGGSYARRFSIGRGGSVALELGDGTVHIDAADLLP